MVAALNREFAREIPEAVVVAFGPPAIPGLGTGAGFTMQLQDRVGVTPEFLAEQTERFIQAARQRPEIGRDLDALPRLGPADLRRHRPVEGAQGGRADLSTSTTRSAPCSAAPT